MKPLVYHPAVDEELAEAVDFYEARQQGLGRRFFEEYLQAIDRIQEDPLTDFLSDKGTRILRIQRFPLGIVFKESSDRISVAALYHFSRRPNYWADRIEEDD
ncbi:MAG: type II toxin-antitoxin system RelE/ParE family toxin [Planctomycetaceae bacterium]